MENLRIYIERNGRPFNYLMSIEGLDELREIYIKNRDKQVIEEMEEEEARKKRELEEEFLLKEKQAKERHAKLLERT